MTAAAAKIARPARAAQALGVDVALREPLRLAADVVHLELPGFVTYLTYGDVRDVRGGTLLSACFIFEPSVSL
jgi:hypothetical protein